jgi:glycosyltransferase involved in cell wall biosynthesis
MPIKTERPVVLQVLPSLVTGGVERGAVEIAQAIAARGWLALVASVGGPMVSAVERAGGRHLNLPLDSKNPLDVWRNAERLAEVIDVEQVAIVHARSRAPAWSAWLACRRTGARFVTTYHGTYAEDLPFKRQYNAVMARGERVIVASRFIADLVRARHGADPARIRVIPRGVDPAAFDPGSVSGDRVAGLARAWWLPNDAPVVLLPGRLTGWKGQTVMIAALARLRRRDVCCVLVGSDQGRTRHAAALLRQAQVLGVADRLHLVGECDDMPAALRLADVVVHASTEPEAFGRVVIEAQAMARPVIASDLGGPTETVEHGVTGWRVPPGNAEALAAAIEQALALPEAERIGMGARARASVLRGYTVAAMQAATLGVYDELLVGVAAVAA